MILPEDLQKLSVGEFDKCSNVDILISIILGFDVLVMFISAEYIISQVLV